MKIKSNENIEFGQTVAKLIERQNLTFAEAYSAACSVLQNQVTDMQQGAFLAALSTKGETADEVAGVWQAVYDLDTVKVELPDDLAVVDNCGTGMDSFKTFNISTAASIIAAAGGVTVARHGARAITSSCGTVDMAEMLGVDVECDAGLVADSIRATNLGLFNGMSAAIHPMALGRILSQINFGSPLNIAASLANPALPKIGVRGVYNQKLILPVIEVMKSIGYTDAIVLYGTIDGREEGMDEASVCGTTYVAQLAGGRIRQFSFVPEDFGLARWAPDDLASDPNETAAASMVSLLAGDVVGARREAVVLNGALLFYVTKMVATLGEGVEKAEILLAGGDVFAQLEKWVTVQNRNPAQGLAKLQLLQEGCS